MPYTTNILENLIPDNNNYFKLSCYQLKAFGLYKSLIWHNPKSQTIFDKVS